MNSITIGRLGAAGLAVAVIGVGDACIAARAQSPGEMGGMAREHAKIVGGATMYPTRTILQNAAGAKDLTTLVAAVRAAGLAETLGDLGPFTVFAPTNAAFAKLPAGVARWVMAPTNRAHLAEMLDYHVIAGRLTVADLLTMVRAGGGRTVLTTLQGRPLVVTAEGRRIVLTDARGRVAHVTVDDVLQSNGVVHLVDAVLLPG